MHPPNELKVDGERLSVIRDSISYGRTPAGQAGHWDVVGAVDWRPKERTEALVVVAIGRDTSAERVQRFSAGLRMQDNQAFGVVVIDDNSLRSAPGVFRALDWLGDRLTLVRNVHRVGRMANLRRALLDVCESDDTMVLIVDLDDALMHPGAVSKFVAASRLGHDVVVGTMFRPDAPTREYRPDFDDPRGKFGGDVWIHPRAYRRGLFRMLPDDLLKDAGAWLLECTDYATMVPMVELALSPIYIPEYLYWHERHTVLDEHGAKLRDELVERILARRLPDNLLGAARRRASTREAS